MVKTDGKALTNYIMATRAGELRALADATEAKLRALWEHEDRTQAECDAIMAQHEARLQAIVDEALAVLLNAALAPWRKPGRTVQ